MAKCTNRFLISSSIPTRSIRFFCPYLYRFCFQRLLGLQVWIALPVLRVAKSDPSYFCGAFRGLLGVAVRAVTGAFRYLRDVTARYASSTAWSEVTNDLGKRSSQSLVGRSALTCARVRPATTDLFTRWWIVSS